MANPKHAPTEESRTLVKSLSAVGVTHEDIALKLEISADTLTKHYRAELDAGRIDANAAVAKSLYEQCRAGNTSAMIFWLKTRARWKETTAHEISGPDGGEIQVVTGI